MQQQQLPFTPPQSASQLPLNQQQQLAQLEELAVKQYTVGDAKAAAMLAMFQTDSGCIAQSRVILDNSANQFALLLAAKSLKELLPTFFHTFTGAQTLEIRNYLLNYLANMCQTLPQFVMKELVEVVARVTKLGWRQDPTALAGQMTASTDAATSAPGGPSTVQPGSHAAFVETCGTFFQHSLKHHQVGLLLLETLVSQMETALNVESPSDHRKTSRLFRDHALLEIVRISLNEIRGVGNFIRAGENPKEIETLLCFSLHLFSTSLSFDFIGSVVDETASDDSNITLQIPSNWRTLVEDTSATSPCALFAQCFEESQGLPDVRAGCLTAFTCLASVRRSLFTNEDSRLNFMKYLMDTQGSLIQKYGTRTNNTNVECILVDDEQNYHEFARFVARFKYNFTLNDLVKSSTFESWLQTLYAFTVQTGFQNWESEANALSYLLGVWSRIASDVSQLKMSDGSSTYQIMNTSLLNPNQPQPVTHSHKVQAIILEVIPKICEIFIDSRLGSVASFLSDGRGLNDAEAEETYNDIFAEPNLSDQLKYMSVLCRFHYVQVKTFIKTRWEPLVEQYKLLLQTLLGGGNNASWMMPSANGLPHTQAETVVQLQVVESQLTLLIYLIGCIVGCEKSLILLHHPSQQHVQNYPFANVEKMSTNDHLQFLDAELISWVLNLLPIINVRIEKSSPTASTVRQRATISEMSCLNQSRRHCCLSILYFFNEFRRKYFHSIGSQSFDSYSSYSRASMYGVNTLLAPTPSSPVNNDTMDGSSSNTPSTPAIPTLEMIGHGPTANIFSRTAFWLQQPMTPVHLLSLIVKEFLIFFNYVSLDFDVMRETLEVFDQLSINYTTSQPLSNLDDIKSFLSNNRVSLGTSVSTTNGNSSVSTEVKTMSSSSAASSSSQLLISDMAFLHSTAHPRLQTTFYQIVSRLVFKGTNIDMFPQFIEPFTIQLQQLNAVSDLRAMTEPLVNQVILLICKLHGVVSAINSGIVFNIFFEWFIETNRFSALILRLVETFWDKPHVLIPILNFYSEFIYNKAQRIRFDSNSANGVILFKETFKIVSTYVQRMAMVSQAQTQSASSDSSSADTLYEVRLKGISKVLQLVSNSLSGNYCNFGIMALYNDPTLKQCLTQTLQFAMSVRFAHIVNYVKVANNYFTFIEVLFNHHLELVIELCDTPKFLAIISSLHEGLLSLHNSQIMQASNSLDHLMKFYFDKKKKSGHSRAILERHLQQSSTLLPEILCTLFNINLFDEIDNDWQLGRPIWGLLLNFPDYFQFYKQRLLQAQTLPPSAQPELAAKIQAASDGLLSGITQTADYSQREKFQSNLLEFRTKIKSFCTRPI